MFDKKNLKKMFKKAANFADKNFSEEGRMKRLENETKQVDEQLKRVKKQSDLQRKKDKLRELQRKNDPFIF